MKFVGRLAQWLLKPSKRSRSKRYLQPGLVAHYWDGAVSVPHEIRDISSTGAYVCTTERWYPGTIIQLTFSPKLETQPNAPAGFIIVPCEIVRHNRDGVGVRFIPPNREARNALRHFIRNVIAKVKQKNATS